MFLVVLLVKPLNSISSGGCVEGSFCIQLCSDVSVSCVCHSEIFFMLSLVGVLCGHEIYIFNCR